MEPKAEKKTATAAKKPVAPKKTETKAAAKPAAAKPAKKEAPAKGAKLVVVQHGSTTGVKPGMKATLAGLGLGKPRSRRELEDTPAVRGMIRKVRHLVHVEGEA